MNDADAFLGYWVITFTFILSTMCFSPFLTSGNNRIVIIGVGAITCCIILVFFIVKKVGRSNE